MRSMTWMGAAVIALAAAGCGTSATTGGGLGGGTAANGAPIAIEALDTTLKTAVCQMGETCPNSELQFSSVAACLAFMASNNEFGASENVAAVKAGRMKYDAAKAGLCLKGLAAACTLEAEPEGCDEVFVGLVKDGDACNQNNECVPGSHCKQSESDCPGVCQKRPAIGEACPDYNCVDGAKCEQNRPEPKCVADVLAKKGESCMEASCEQGLSCDYSSESPTCLEPGAAGADCDSSSMCQTGLWCGQKTCKAAAKQGEACLQPYKAGVCEAGSACSVVGEAPEKGMPTMTCLATKKMGEACTSHQQCTAIDLFCKGLDSKVATSTGTCALLPVLGEACTAFGPSFPQAPSCQPGLTCDKATSKCVGPAAKGQPCGGDANIDCADGLDCEYADNADTGTCIEPKAPVCE